MTDNITTHDAIDSRPANLRYCSIMRKCRIFAAPYPTIINNTDASDAAAARKIPKNSGVLIPFVIVAVLRLPQ